jgi:formamidopyrimidine-DNA glycosylase
LLELPELPEVETIRNELAPYITGRRFTSITICDAKPIRETSVEEFCRRLAGQKINSLRRRGKYLFFHLSSGEILIIHLRMTGALLLNPEQPDRYTRVIFGLDNGSQLVFTDRRRLGVLRVMKSEYTITRKLGAEPLSLKFTAEVLGSLLRKHQAPIKAVLLDQAIVAGIGNMYADEALHVANIHPMRKANSLSLKEIQKLHRAIRDILSQAISNKGASIDTYKRPDGKQGTAQFSFHVAHRGSQPCDVCGTPIQRLAIRNRGSYFCPKCQEL